ncbi:single-stranded DNA-binding protein, mitochondrial [Schistocerca americana]|uniref:single-stranded DNA-binding protein, mitochondrial n=1 Tax=Schistocerca americana TaxID=7009 RepID=UPI001F500A4F|nr:single-stranded DNA-binding protein, mitochondrial [Schistocerca americana]
MLTLGRGCVFKILGGRVEGDENNSLFVGSDFIMFCRKFSGLLSQQLYSSILRCNRQFAEKLETSNIEKTINEVKLLGRVGAEPQRRGTEEHPVVIFSLATHTNYKYESGEFVQRTDWHRICVFKPSLREVVYNYLKKGQRVYITGRLTYGEVKDGEGNTRTTTAVVADDVIFFQSSEPS